jgi:tetratricopeptide (TPR) repeat protein
MTRMLNLILPALVLGVGISAQAQVVGRLLGKVTSKDGKPVKDAKVTLKRLDMNWSKTLTTDANGTFGQAGLEPKEFDMTITADGFVTKVERVKVPIGDSVTKDIQLLRPSEAGAGGGGQAAVQVDEGAKLEAEGLNLFNDNLELYNQGRFAEAIGPFETAYKSLKDSLDKTTKEDVRADLKPKVEMVERILGLTYFQVGKKDQAEPFLLNALARKADDRNALIAIVEIYKARKDAVNEKKYRDALEVLTGPDPNASYNRGVEAFNAGKIKEARGHVEETLKIDPKYATAYYLLGMVELNDNHMGAARVAFQKYLELDPKGKNVGEVKEILKGIPAK